MHKAIGAKPSAGEGAANVFDENFAAKSAYGALRQTLTLAAGRE